MQRNKTNDIRVVGPFSPGQGESLVMNGAIDGGYIWNPMTAGGGFCPSRKNDDDGRRNQRWHDYRGYGSGKSRMLRAIIFSAIKLKAKTKITLRI